MTKEEIIEKIEDNPIFPYIQPDSLKEIVEFVIENSISLKEPEPQGLEVAAKEASIEYQIANCPICIGGDSFEQAVKDMNLNKAYFDGYIAGAKWMAGQGVVVEGKFHRSCGYPSVIELNTYLRDYDGDKVIVQIRKKEE